MYYLLYVKFDLDLAHATLSALFNCPGQLNRWSDRLEWLFMTKGTVPIFMIVDLHYRIALMILCVLNKTWSFGVHFTWPVLRSSKRWIFSTYLLWSKIFMFFPVFLVEASLSWRSLTSFAWAISSGVILSFIFTGVVPLEARVQLRFRWFLSIKKKRKSKRALTLDSLCTWQELFSTTKNNNVISDVV